MASDDCPLLRVEAAAPQPVRRGCDENRQFVKSLLSASAAAALLTGIAFLVPKGARAGNDDQFLASADTTGLWFGSGKPNAISEWNNKLDSVLFQSGDGLYYEFATAQGEAVWTGEVEGMHAFADAKSIFPLASASKLFTAFAVMMTMELKPHDWYPEKYVNEFSGWENFSNFKVEHYNKSIRANLTIHHLLTHTSGLPFSMRASKKDIARMKLFYWPGTQYGYTLGHRVAGWMLRDYWKQQPEAANANISTVDDTLRWLVFERLGLSNSTGFSDTMHHLFGHSGDAGDASISSTGADMIKLAIVALNRGKLLDGTVLISESNWNNWAVPNLLPGGKLSKDLVGWEHGSASWKNFNVGGMKEQIMRQSGDFGWNYFGATYNNSKEIGWCGFFSSCLRVSYEHKLSFVMMQRDVADVKKSKPYLVRHFADMATSLQCRGGAKCFRRGHPSVFCQVGRRTEAWTSSCPRRSSRGKLWSGDTKLDVHHHTCYTPSC